jgi:hypothetical protein
VTGKSRASRAQNQIEKGIIGQLKMQEVDTLNKLGPFQENNTALSSYNQLMKIIFQKSAQLFI